MAKVWRNPRLSGRIKELDGLRGLAILLVLIQHYVVDSVPIMKIDWKAYAVYPLRFCWTGVDLFFVLSGFLIGGILIDAKSTTNYYRTFYARRVHRIFPLYYLWLVLFAIGFKFSLSSKADFALALFHRDMPLWTYPLFLQNIAMSLRNNVGPIFLGITWSLAVEEQFYLLLPAIIRNLSIKNIVRLACAAIVIAPLLRFLLARGGSGMMGPYSLLPCRADTLAFGVIIAAALRNQAIWTWLESHRRHLYLVFSFLALGVCSLVAVRHPLTKPLFLSLGFSAFAAFYACLLLLLVANPGRIERWVFGWKPLVGLGTISYCVYIIHESTNFLWHGAVFGRVPAFDTLPSIAITFASLLTVILLAQLSWRYLERPLIRRAHSRFRYIESTPAIQDLTGNDQIVPSSA